MKMWMCGLMTGILFGSCAKTNDLKDIARAIEGPVITIRTPKYPYLPPLSVCINSYTQFYNSVGTNVLTVRAVILENGTTVPVGGNVISITYTAVNTNEPHSLFRSKLLTVYDVSGYPQSSFQDVWTLGCVYESSGVPPFTDLVWRNRLYEINTAFFFGTPALVVPVMKIRYLVVD